MWEGVEFIDHKERKLPQKFPKSKKQPKVTCQSKGSISGLIDQEPLVCYDCLDGSLGADTGLVCAGQ